MNSEKIKIIAMNLWVYGVLLWMTIAGILLTPIVGFYLFLRHGWQTPRIIRHIIWLYGKGWLAIISPFVSFQRQGLDDAEVPDNCIFVINHLSFFDTYFMGALPQSDITFAVRSWPFKMFWYRLFMQLANYLEVEDMSWEQTLIKGNLVLKQGGAVLFFPEGHRSRTGKMQRFYSGAFHLATQSGCPIVPLCITGTDELLPPGRRTLRPATVRLKILPVVEVAKYQFEGGHRQLRKDVKAIMAKELEQMLAANGAAGEGR